MVNNNNNKQKEIYFQMECHVLGILKCPKTVAISIISYFNNKTLQSARNIHATSPRDKIDRP